ncbi:MAG: glycosyltransferase family 4 protein [Chitinophagaceae bacterium]
MFTLEKYDRIFIQRGAAPFGPPVFEWIIHFIWRKPIVYDYDDAIWLQPQKKTTWSNRLIKAYYKVGMICNWSHTIVAGNEYLANYARQFNSKVMVIPTVVDTETRFVPSPVIKSSRKPVIGWTGSHTTLFYLEKMESVLLQLKAEHDFELLVIANKPPVFSELTYRFVRWTEDSEIEDLRQIDIGLMPLTDDEWTKGKCGFKLIQYLSLGIPAVADPVGVNKLIIEDGINGFLCETTDEWIIALIALINDTEMRHTMGREGRAKIINQYSLRSQATQFLSLFN